MISKYPLGHYGLLAIIKSLVHPTPLAKTLLRHVPLHAGQCYAFVPDYVTDQDMIFHQSGSYKWAFNPETFSSSAVDDCIVTIISDYFRLKGESAIGLIESLDDTQTSYNPEHEVVWDICYFEDHPYLTLKSPLPDRDGILDYLAEVSSFSNSPTILANDRNAVIRHSSHVDFNLLQQVAQQTDIIIVPAFDDTSYIIWERI